MTIRNIIIIYRGLNKEGACGLSFNPETRTAVVVELVGSQFTSVTNAAENIAPIVAEKMGMPLGEFRLFEAYQNRIRDGIDYELFEVFATNGIRWKPAHEQDKQALIPYLRPWELKHLPL